MSNIAEALRAAGHLERWSTHRHNIGFYVNVGVTARYTNPRQRLTRRVLFRALKSVISAHALLGLTVLDEDTATPYFGRLNEINLDEVVSFVQLSANTAEGQRQKLGQILSEQHRTRFQELGRLPAWRVLVVEPETRGGVDVVFIFHHGIGDGGTGEAFHISLLRALDSDSLSEGGSDIESIVKPPAIPLLGALETVIPMPLSYKYLLAGFWTRVWFVRAPSPTLWCGAPIHLSPDGLKTSIQILVFSSETLQHLLSACRVEKVTLTTLLQVLIAKSFFSVLPAGPPSPVTEIISSVAINLRRFMPDVTDETMGVFVSSTSTNHSRDDLTKSIWDLARSYKAHLDDRIKAGTQDSDTGLLKYLRDYVAFFTSRIGKQRGDSFGISNLGAFKGRPGENGWDIPTSMTFSQSASVTGCAVEFSMVSVKGGELSICVGYQEGVVEKEIMDKFVEVFQSEVEDIAAGIE